MNEVIDERLCDLHDLQEFLKARNLLNEPKDNDGSIFSIGDVVEDLIDKAHA